MAKSRQARFTFKEGDAYAVAGGTVYRVERVIVLNGVEKVLYSTSASLNAPSALPTSAALPPAEFAQLLASYNAVQVKFSSGT